MPCQPRAAGGTPRSEGHRVGTHALRSSPHTAPPLPYTPLVRSRLLRPGDSGAALKRALAGSQPPGYNAGMSSTIWMLLAAAGVMAASFAATGLVLPLLRRRAVLDHPNERSSHAVPTPRGGGIAVVVVLLAAWGASAMQTPQPGLWIVLAAAAGQIGSASCRERVCQYV